MNTQPDREADFLAHARKLHAASLASLDASVTARLRAARQRAVAETGHRLPLWRAHPWSVPGGITALLVMGIAAGLLVWSWASTPGVAFAAASNDDIPIVLSNDNLDMYANMDFYRWLQAQQQAGQAAPTQPASDGNG